MSACHNIVFLLQEKSDHFRLPFPLSDLIRSSLNIYVKVYPLEIILTLKKKIQQNWAADKEECHTAIAQRDKGEEPTASES